MHRRAQVKDGKTFLDLIAEQVKVMRVQYGSNVKFILMNRCAPAYWPLCDTMLVVVCACAQVCQHGWSRMSPRLGSLLVVQAGSVCFVAKQQPVAKVLCKPHAAHNCCATV